jgi:DNA-binding winged helix-turn-helix (wHTH) protein
MVPVNPFELGEWTVVPARNELLSATRKQAIEPRAMELLVRLASAPGTVISKDKLLRDVWQGAHVVEHVLPKTMSGLRKALGDRARSARFIETVAGRGYVLLVEPRPVTDGAPPRPERVEVAGEVSSGDGVCRETSSMVAAVSSTNLPSAATPAARPIVRLFTMGRGFAAAVAALVVFTLLPPRIHTEPRSRVTVVPTRGRDAARARDAEDALVHDLAKSSCLMVTKETGSEYRVESNIVDMAGTSILRTRLVHNGIYVMAGDVPARDRVVAASPVATRRVLQHICRDHKCSCPPRFFGPPAS